MRRNRSWLGLEPGVMILILGSVLSSAQADPITIPGYTVTDLGAGTPTLSTDANGNGVLNAPNGQVYAFSQTSNATLTPGQGVMANFPLPFAAPVNDPNTYGNPLFAFAYVQSATMNANGTVVAIEDWGVNGHYGFSEAYVVQSNGNGSWGAPVTIWQGNEQFFNVPPVSSANLVTGINNLNQVLGSAGIGGPQNDITDATLYNTSSHTLVDLSVLLGAAGFANDQPIALDADGRILLSATEFSQTLGPTQTNILLTPDGLPAAPLEVPAPEPASIAVMLLAMVGFAWHRRRERHTETPQEIRF
jgi:PEP-CTERM motif